MVIHSEAHLWLEVTRTHMLPVKADVRAAIGKEAGDSVTVRLQERIDD
jgi:hypothetical protein